MAISQIGNITHINQNALLNSQLQANALNQPNVQSAMNIQDFSEKMQENVEVRPTEGIEKVDKDSSNSNKQEYKKDEEHNLKSSNTTLESKKHKNIYASSERSMLDIEV